MKLEIIPEALSRLKNPPKELNFIGDTSLLSMPKVAVVGSRKASVYTKECVTALCAALKSANVCVVSGGAIGVDITAHKAAMPRTIGVFANGLDIIYPAQNKAAIREIYEKGLALSEYGEGEPPIAGDHPLLHAPNVILAPHVGFATQEAMEKRAVIAFKNVQAYLAGKPQNVM